MDASDARLISGGLRGYGVFSTVLHDVRCLHPQELSLLNSLPLTALDFASKVKITVPRCHEAAISASAPSRSQIRLEYPFSHFFLEFLNKNERDLSIPREHDVQTSGSVAAKALQTQRFFWPPTIS